MPVVKPAGKATSGALPIVKAIPQATPLAVATSKSPAMAKAANERIAAVVPITAQTKYPTWVWITAGAAAAVLALAILVGLSMALFGGRGAGANNPAPARGTSSLHTDGQRLPSPSAKHVEG
jgi:hypothetical protein